METRSLDSLFKEVRVFKVRDADQSLSVAHCLLQPIVIERFQAVDPDVWYGCPPNPDLLFLFCGGRRKITKKRTFILSEPLMSLERRETHSKKQGPTFFLGMGGGKSPRKGFILPVFLFLEHLDRGCFDNEKRLIATLTRLGAPSSQSCSNERTSFNSCTVEILVARAIRNAIRANRFARIIRNSNPYFYSASGRFA